MNNSLQTSVIIQPPRRWTSIDLRDIWAYRELLYFFTWRQIKLRYKQTVLGFAWAIIQPLATMVVFTMFFGNLLKVPSDGIPYPIFSYTALLPWGLFSTGLTSAANSLLQDSNLVKKVYFPRLVLPFSSILPPLVDFAIAFIILLGMMVYFHYGFTIKMLLLPVFLIIAMLTSLAVGIWLTSIIVKYRDVRYVTSFLIQLWLFASPVVYPSSLLPQQLQVFYRLNPMAGVVEGFRWALIGTPPPGVFPVAISTVMVILILVSGMFYFQRSEKSFADVI